MVKIWNEERVGSLNESKIFLRSYKKKKENSEIL